MLIKNLIRVQKKMVRAGVGSHSKDASKPQPANKATMHHELMQFQDNPYFTAGFGLIGVGACLTALRQGSVRLLSLFQKRYMSSIEITSRHPSYPWVLQWLTNSIQTGSHFSVQSSPRCKEGLLPFNSCLVPSPGVHYVKFMGKWIKVQRERERAAVDIGGVGTAPFETIKMTTIGSNPSVLLNVISGASFMAESQAEGKLILYTSFAAEWRPFGNPRRRRPLHSVILDEDIAGHIWADVQEFLESGEWYTDRGIPYRRGYLLHGPPGTGKSSFIQALASELGYSICLLNLADGMVTDDRLQHLFNAIPEKSILLLEDIDAVGLDTSNTSVKKNEGLQKLTLSGLLNALDGIGSSEERIVFMTTNHYDRLAPALIRPGRIDVQHYIGLASPSQAHRMFMRFYPGCDELAEKFSNLVASHQVSPATIQGHFIQHKDDPVKALESFEIFLHCNRAKLAKLYSSKK